MSHRRKTVEKGKRSRLPEGSFWYKAALVTLYRL